MLENGALGRWFSHEGEALTNGISTPLKRPLTGEMLCQKKASPRHENQRLDLHVKARHKSMCLKPQHWGSRGRSPGGLLALPLTEFVSSRISRRPYLKKIKWKKNQERHLTSTFGLHTTYTDTNIFTHKQTHSHTCKQIHIHANTDIHTHKNCAICET